MVLLFVPALAQEEQQTVYHARKYLDINIQAKEKFNKRATKQQKKLLTKLKRKEDRFAKRLKRKNPESFKKYKQNKNNFDSIASNNKNGYSSKKHSFIQPVNKAIDSLKGVRNFLEEKAHVTGTRQSEDDKYAGKLNELKQENEHINNINAQIKNRATYLSSFKTKKGKSIRGLKSIKKNTFYSNKKTEYFKQISDEPSRLEERSLEYLQGEKGFTEHLGYSESNAITPQNSMSIEDLEKKGFQTKRTMQNRLTGRVGGDLNPLQKQLGDQLEGYDQKLQKAKDVKNDVRQTKSKLKLKRSTPKPDFHVNKMRGIPFHKRFEYQYNWQTNRATLDGQPVIFSLAYMVGFKHTSNLSYGAGVATSIGLGQNWNNVKFSFQGIGFRTYSNWNWRYGVGLYAGYERMYKRPVFVGQQEQLFQANETPHNKEAYNEALLLGITKTYRINNKFNGSLQLLYDCWWKEKGLRSPIVLRVATKKN